MVLGKNSVFCQKNKTKFSYSLKSFGHSQEAWCSAGSNNNKPLGAERVKRLALSRKKFKFTIFSSSSFFLTVETDCFLYLLLVLSLILRPFWSGLLLFFHFLFSFAMLAGQTFLSPTQQILAPHLSRLGCYSEWETRRKISLMLFFGLTASGFGVTGYAVLPTPRFM